MNRIYSGVVLTCPGAIYMYMTFIVKQVYWYIFRITGERLQDHWSSGLIFARKYRLWVLIRTASGSNVYPQSMI